MADIVLDGVYKTYSDGYTAVKDLNLDIADGEFMILVGPSGCGKSTALNMIAGLEDITAGELRIGGEVVNKKAPRDRDIAMVFQSYALYPHMTVRDNIAFALKLAKRPKEEIDARSRRRPTSSTSASTSSASRPTCPAASASASPWAARSCATPKAFLMDEPLSNLDAKLRVQMRAEVARIQHRLNTTTVYVTHDQTEAMTLGDRVAIMLSGELQQVASPMELYNNPQNLFVAGFIGSPGMNFLPATIDGDTAKLPMVSVKLPQEIRERIGRVEPGKKLIAGIRPEDFEDATQVPAETRGRGTTFHTTFDLVEAMGAEFYVHFGVKADQMQGSAHMDALMEDQGGIAESGDEGEAVVVARLDAESRAKTGEQTEVWLDATKMHFFDADTGRALSAK